MKNFSWVSVTKIKQVCSNKDASEGRDQDRIAERDKPDLNAGGLLQVVCNLFAGHMLLSIRGTDRPMDRRSDRQTDRALKC